MTLLFETIRFENFKPFFIEYHNDRVNRSIYELFGLNKNYDLIKFLTPPNGKLLKCRVLYNTNIILSEFVEYFPRNIKSFKIVESDISYKYKYLNRDEIDKLFNLRENFDEIIIASDSLISDTSIANIAIFDGENWLTPKKPLLYGTTRARLLEVGFLKEANITICDLKNAKSIALLNSMIGFKIIDDFNIN